MLWREARRELGLDGCKLVHLLGLSVLGFCLVHMPVFDPVKEAFVFLIHESVNLPVEPLQPVELHHVQFNNRNAADLCP